MPTGLVDSVAFRDVFRTESMRSVCSDENRNQRCLDVEIALSRAQASLGTDSWRRFVELYAPLLLVWARRQEHAPPTTARESFVRARDDGGCIMKFLEAQGSKSRRCTSFEALRTRG
jgi:hypothetical protein